ncbi:membrane-spanning 4-domains subfamily A member 15-like isoform X1 [Sphaerodactylus townsendi]|uniref:membrane-spanning 4-domains subfamily A member 15-like isoform X1 n=1 Tax=Sphaerodactylus townsendi TaxID=933632 RepID=UPI002026D1E5|nr:membrane-spanning 4-domains subfamily A member 15-like isoform X1 [Sphaerodactylus townsendi]
MFTNSPPPPRPLWGVPVLCCLLFPVAPPLPFQGVCAGAAPTASTQGLAPGRGARIGAGRREAGPWCPPRGRCRTGQPWQEVRPGLARVQSRPLGLIRLVSSLLANMDLKDPETLASISNSIIRPPVQFPVKTLYRGEPMALGITQILIGILEISFGLVLAIVESPPTFYDQEGHMHTPYWLGILYIISGSLSVAAAKTLKVPLVKGMLGMNVVSSVAAGIAIVMFSVSISDPRHYYGCEFHSFTTMTPDICKEHVTIPHNLRQSITAILLTVTVLEFLISITTAAFGCATVCRNDYSETTVVIFQKTVEGTAPA